jgi:hypothetical protein
MTEVEIAGHHISVIKNNFENTRWVTFQSPIFFSWQKNRKGQE